MRGRAVALSLLGLLLWGGGAAAQSAPRFAVRPAGAAEGWRALVEAARILEDPALRSALDGGLPLRFRLRVELWEKRLFDRLLADQEVHLSLVQDPLDGTYTLDTARGERSFATLALAEEALERALRSALRPSGSGRYYYLASLHIETLSLSDLEELRRWLRGEVRPAVEGRGSAGGAVESGLRRVLIRVVGLPTRRYEARSEVFVPR